jgi:hypothetical protein
LKIDTVCFSETVELPVSLYGDKSKKNFIIRYFTVHSEVSFQFRAPIIRLQRI